MKHKINIKGYAQCVDHTYVTRMELICTTEEKAFLFDYKTDTITCCACGESINIAQNVELPSGFEYLRK